MEKPFINRDGHEEYVIELFGAADIEAFADALEATVRYPELAIPYADDTDNESWLREL